MKRLESITDTNNNKNHNQKQNSMINIVEQDSEQFESPSVSYKIYRLGSLENKISNSSGKPEFI